MPEIFQVDAFTDVAFKGNPAAVCILEGELEQDLYLKISSEMNLSETAFVYPVDGKPHNLAQRFSLRWFTPKVEVPLCGHATLATAKVLFDELNNQNRELEFETKSGVLKAKKEGDLILMDFPTNEPKEIEREDELGQILGYKTLIRMAYSQEAQKLLIHIEDPNELKQLKPDFGRLMSHKFETGFIGIIVTSESESGDNFDFISRFFAPWVGVPEDPVTGSAHTVLYPYWSKLLGKNELVAYQASSRGGKLRLRAIGDSRVEIGGEAVVVLRGKLEI
jgi:PhzF family phenazine biosynthesis protein